MAIVGNDVNWIKLAREWPNIVAKKGRELAEKRRREAKEAAKQRR